MAKLPNYHRNSTGRFSLVETKEIFDSEPTDWFESIDTVITEEDDLRDSPLWDLDTNDNATFFSEGTNEPSSWIEYYRLKAINGELFLLDDLISRNFWKQYISWADKWDCKCLPNDLTQCCN